MFPFGNAPVMRPEHPRHAENRFLTPAHDNSGKAPTASSGAEGCLDRFTPATAQRDTCLYLQPQQAQSPTPAPRPPAREAGSAQGTGPASSAVAIPLAGLVALAELTQRQLEQVRTQVVSKDADLGQRLGARLNDTCERLTSADRCADNGARAARLSEAAEAVAAVLQLLETATKRGHVQTAAEDVLVGTALLERLERDIRTIAR